MQPTTRPSALAAQAAAVLLLSFPVCAPAPGFVDGPGGKIYYSDGPVESERTASGDRHSRLPVVLLHGFAGNADHWALLPNQLRHHRRTVAIDLRGHGRSEALGPYSIPELAGDVIAVVDALDLERFVLVGHSMSGLIALECAHRLGDARVAGVYLLDSGGAAILYPEPMKAKILAQVARDTHAETIEAYWADMLGDASPELRARLFADLAKLSRPAIEGLMESMFVYDPRPALLGYEGVLGALITGANDGPNALQRFRGDFPVERISSANHWWHLNEPERFYELLARFLESVDRRAAGAALRAR